MVLVWIQLVVCAVAIWFSGVRLSRYGDAIAEKSGASRSWVGLILLATVTSLPELVTGLSAVGLAGTPDIAVGDALGSCVFNLAILVVVDLVHRQSSPYTRAGRGHVLTAAFGVVLLGAVGFGILASRLAGAALTVHIGLASPVLIALYVIAVRTLFRFEQGQLPPADEAAEVRHPGLTLRAASLRYALWSVGVVAAGLALPFVGARLAEVMGWEQSFVGSLFIALSTSIPELVVTISAVRLGALDLAIGNLLGSNLFNVLILAIDDLVYRGPLLADVSPIHAVTAMSAVTMTGVAIAALLYRPQSRAFGAVGWVSLALFALYLLNAFVLSLYRG
jgi:cation:H+ antiporter